jgi:hypothetical protein
MKVISLNYGKPGCKPIQDSANMEDKSIIGQLQNELPIGENKVNSYEDLKEKWALYFNNLIQHDFPELVNLLYRIDISEEKLRRILKENPDENAGKIITTLVIERLSQKIRSRKEFRSSPDVFSDDPGTEKW